MPNQSQKPISIIVAHDLKGVIGYRGKLPWNLPSDLAHFKDKTFGNPVIMGRKTYQSILHRLAQTSALQNKHCSLRQL